MQMKSRIGPRAAVLAVVAALAAFATACGGGSGTGGAKPPAAGSAGTATAPGNPPAGKAGVHAVISTEARIQQALPDPDSMKGWTPKTGEASVVEKPKSEAECATGTDWDCAEIAGGSAKFEEFGETARFRITAFADEKAAAAACAKEKDWSAKYTKANAQPVPGAESHAYYRNVGGLDGVHLFICLGTVIGEVTLEGGGSDLNPATARSLAQIFVSRIQKAAAAP